MRKTFAIHGGVHPPENKHQSVRTPIRLAGIPDELVFPLSQHIGAPAEPIVIELNVNITQEVIYRLADDVRKNIEQNPEIF